MELFESLKGQIAGKNIKVVLPEGVEPRIITAAVRLQDEKLVKPILLGNQEEIKKIAKNEGVELGDMEIIDPANYDGIDEMVASFVERRKGKVTPEDAKKMLMNVNYFGTMMTYMGIADAMVSGAIHATGDTVRPALQIVKTKPGVSRTSGSFVMLAPDGRRFLFADCAINITVGAQEMAEIAVESARNAKMFGIDPKVAMLSFSTAGSAKGPEAEKVAEATRIAKELAPDLAIDGEMQFDAAIVDTVAKQKMPNSKVAGNANVFIFPSLEAGNIGYKIAQRLGGFQAIGPILQGLNKPISDLSRGCNAEDVYKLTIITAAQSLM